jgi:hypothetical protein
MLALAAAYTVLRSVVGGPELGATLGRLAKVGVLGTGVAGLIALAHAGWVPISSRLVAGRRAAAWLTCVVLLLAACAALLPGIGWFVREKLTFAGFVVFYLCSPIIVLPASPLLFDPGAPVYWLGGLAALGAVAGLVLLFWRPVLGSPTFIFAAAFVIASIVPVSSMTEGKRYLYLASAGAAFLAGFIVEQVRGRYALATAAVVTAYLALSVWQIEVKAQQWQWAGEMTRDAVRLVDGLRGSACVGNDILLLTAPVGIHDVYSHLYRDTFIGSDGCGPRSVRSLVRVIGHDVSLVARWPAGGAAIEMEIARYRGDFVASRDLRRFDIPLSATGPRAVETPAGRLEFRPSRGGATLSLAPGSAYDPRHTTFRYFSDGAIRLLPPPPGQP